MTIIPGAQWRQLWGSLASCGRLSIGLVRIHLKTAADANCRAGCHPAARDLGNRRYFGRTTLARIGSITGSPIVALRVANADQNAH